MFYNCDELPLLSASIAIALSKELDNDELNILGNFFAALGTEMTTIAAVRESNTEDSNLIAK